MSLFQDTDDDSRTPAQRLTDVLRRSGDERAATFARSLGASVGLSPERRAALYYAGLLHGIGTLGIAVLPEGTGDIVRWQHECWDGCGSPDGLRWDGVPADAQYLQLALVAVSADSPDDALVTVSEQSGRRFAPQYARAFAAWFAQTGGEPSDEPAPDLADVGDADVARARDALSALRGPSA